LKKNISCNAHVLNELLEMDDAIVVSAGKRGNCGIPLENCTVLCVKDDWNYGRVLCHVVYKLYELTK
jgi:hypothetical protein